jgi:hypothetical protein
MDAMNIRSSDGQGIYLNRLWIEGFGQRWADPVG